MKLLRIGNKGQEQAAKQNGGTFGQHELSPWVPGKTKPRPRRRANGADHQEGEI